MKRRVQARNLSSNHLGQTVKIGEDWYEIQSIEHNRKSGTWLELADPGHSDAWVRFEYGDTLLEFKND